MSDTRIESFDGQYRFLSNFWAVPIRVHPREFNSLESAYQSQKMAKDADKSRFMGLGASAAKKLGQELPMRKDWNAVKIDTMLNLLHQKFSRPGMGNLLRETGDAYLLEGNYWHDNFWGSCTCKRCGNKGQNMLGKLLMQVRSEISNKPS